MKDVYILIPVYKGLEETRACLASVLSCSQGTEVLVIDDASPDPDIQRYVASLEKDPTRVRVFRNHVNKGFVRTVNRGFGHDRQKDVIILNSDTIVTPGWVEKLRTWAYADPRAASVTPMSNSATICSYPLINRCNPLPDAFSPDDLNALFEASGAFQQDALIEIPTGIGFCLYIKREYLDKAGYFNDTLFGTGYGEENDFCLRCSDQGGRHLAATDTFIYHREGVSFSKDQKQQQTVHAIKVLNQTYPGYDAAIQQFLESDPLAVIRKKVDMLRFSRSGKKGILLISHGKGGGVEKHVRELSEIIARANLHPFVLTPLKSRGVVFESAAVSDLFGIEIDTRNWLPKLVTLLQWFGICHLHFHHLLDYHEDIYQLPERSGLTFDVTLHDFFMFCPCINGYIEDTDYYCGFEGPGACNRCGNRGCSEFYHVHSDNIALFREKNETFLKHARNIIAPSHSTCDIYRRYFPSLVISVHSHPEMLDFHGRDKNFPPGPAGPFNEKNRLNIGLLGGLSLQKGRRAFEECIALSRKNKLPVRWVLIGCTDLSDAQVQNDYIITGRYHQKDLPELFSKYGIHLMLLPAKWPETYSYTLSECFALNCPVMVPDIGALGERVKKYGGGMILPSPVTAEVIIARVENLIAHPERLEELKKTHTPSSGEEEDMDAYLHKIYNSLTFSGCYNISVTDLQPEHVEILISLAENKRLSSALQDVKKAAWLTQNHVTNLERHVVNVDEHAKQVEKNADRLQHALAVEQERLIQANGKMDILETERDETRQQLTALEHERHALEADRDNTRQKLLELSNEFHMLKQKIVSFRGVAWSVKLLVKKIVLAFQGKKLEI